jgi:hypothetical protein
MTSPKKEQPGLPDPQKIVENPKMSREQKAERLHRWEHDAQEIETANDEGMRGDVKPSNLDAVHDALRRVGEKPHSACDPNDPNSNSSCQADSS